MRVPASGQNGSLVGEGRIHEGHSPQLYPEQPPRKAAETGRFPVEIRFLPWLARALLSF